MHVPCIWKTAELIVLGNTCKSTICPAVQVITLDHDKYMHELENIAQCHNKSLQARDKLKLRAVAVAGAAACDLTARVPKMYEALGEQAGTPLCKCYQSISQLHFLSLGLIRGVHRQYSGKQYTLSTKCSRRLTI